MINRQEVTNKELLAYCAVFFEYFLKEYRKIGQYPRIDLYTKESGHAVMSLYPCDDKNRQGISIYEGARETDDTVERVNVSGNSTYIVKKNLPENWTKEIAEKDLAQTLDKMRTLAIKEAYNG